MTSTTLNISKPKNADQTANKRRPQTMAGFACKLKFAKRCIMAFSVRHDATVGGVGCGFHQPYERVMSMAVAVIAPPPVTLA